MSGVEAAFFGALGCDAESKVSKTGKPYLRAGVRIGDGEAAQWINVTAFDPAAIAAADKFVKGARVYCEGRLTLGEYMAGDGSKRASLSCMSWHFRLPQIGRNKPKRQRAGSSEAAPAQFAGNFGAEVPF
jgi:single-stranded DNA-binding protein